jgi:hypothetical protein
MTSRMMYGAVITVVGAANRPILIGTPKRLEFAATSRKQISEVISNRYKIDPPRAGPFRPPRGVRSDPLANKPPSLTVVIPNEVGDLRLPCALTSYTQPNRRDRRPCAATDRADHARTPRARHRRSEGLRKWKSPACFSLLAPQAARRIQERVVLEPSSAPLGR